MLGYHADLTNRRPLQQ